MRVVPHPRPIQADNTSVNREVAVLNIHSLRLVVKKPGVTQCIVVRSV